jgi:hypothetical protein
VMVTTTRREGDLVSWGAKAVLYGDALKRE